MVFSIQSHGLSMFESNFMDDYVNLFNCLLCFILSGMMTLNDHCFYKGYIETVSKCW